MLATVHSSTLLGIDALPVEVEVDITSGTTKFDLVGLPDAAVMESRERVRAAIHNSGYSFPLRKIVVNLAPGDVRKGLLEGARLARLRYAGPHMVPLSWAVRSFKIGRPWEAPLHMARAVAGLIAPREKR